MEEETPRTNPNAMIVLCEHCHTKVTGKARFCPDCTTAAKRKEMDEYNNKLWLEKEGKPYICLTYPSIR